MSFFTYLYKYLFAIPFIIAEPYFDIIHYSLSCVFKRLAFLSTHIIRMSNKGMLEYMLNNRGSNTKAIHNSYRRLRVSYIYCTSRFINNKRIFLECLQS